MPAAPARPNRVFFPQALLDAWVADDRVDLEGDELTLKEEARRYKISEAVHVEKDVAGGGDAQKLLGRVKTKDQLNAMQAEVLESSMVVGDDAYEIIPGFVGEPIGSFSSRQAERVSSPDAANDEDLLAQFLLKSL